MAGGDGGIMCGEAGRLQCGFTSATSHPLFKTIISCSIIQMIFTRANYTGHVLQRKWPPCFTVALTQAKSGKLRRFK